MASACLLAIELNSHPLEGWGLPSIIRFLYCFQCAIRNHSSLSISRRSSAALPALYLCRMRSASAACSGPTGGGAWVRNSCSIVFTSYSVKCRPVPPLRPQVEGVVGGGRRAGAHRRADGVFHQDIPALVVDVVLLAGVHVLHIALVVDQGRYGPDK